VLGKYFSLDVRHIGILWY